MATVGLAATGALAAPLVDVRQRLDLPAGGPVTVALTLDACGGGYDAELIATLVRLHVPATVFVTAKWIARHPQGVRDLLAHADLFELENHGAAHRPAAIGQRVYGMRGVADLADAEREIDAGARAVRHVSGRAPAWYRGAGAQYDVESLQLIRHMGYRVAGYSLNADDGATASAATVAARLLAVRSGDIVIAHMNRPSGSTAGALARVLPELLQRGVRFVKLSQAPGVQELPPRQRARANAPARRS